MGKLVVVLLLLFGIVNILRPMLRKREDQPLDWTLRGRNEGRRYSTNELPQKNLLTS